ncbi:hypothetical protein [Fannyhessea vaginae]|uniref:Uncharacterized protein n=1 Tax=Fannyhessea vaginae DSM 15829 TaxID=525256 RepID=F1T4E5_9ACTN|nr:hypothetical protein [Fannyhessea vaginae]EGF23589.1 hypothetical protein HMPREF0091_10536 [Fannyhessea vaginae DSM 15829]QPR41928.1 hypothetical protein I6G91_01070 [Fannyhessea vaginae]SSZ04931.1 Uncharacterised protein [Fannyhessea vaginae]
MDKRLGDMTKEELEKELLIQKILKAKGDVERNDAKNDHLVKSVDNTKTAKVWRVGQYLNFIILIAYMILVAYILSNTFSRLPF